MLRVLSRNAKYACSDSAKHAEERESKRVWYLPVLEFSRVFQTEGQS